MTTLSSFRLLADRRFAKRAATRMAASVAVMVALNAVSHDGPREEAPFGPAAVPATGASLDLDPRPVLVSEATSAKTDRLRRPAPPIGPEIAAAKATPQEAEGVLLFDRCRPLCESRDPLLAGPRRTATEAAPVEPLVQTAAFEQEFDPAETPPAPASGGGVLDAVTSGLSAVAGSGRMIADGAARLLPW